MNYHDILHEDMVNGDGLRVVLFVSGCEHHCEECHNPITWDAKGGIPFDDKAKIEITEQLKQPYIQGITFSGGDPLHKDNVIDVLDLIANIKHKFPHKTIWLYSGYTWEQVFDTKGIDYMVRRQIVQNCDIFVDGNFVKELKSTECHYCGSTNQRVIDVKQTIKKGEIILWT